MTKEERNMHDWRKNPRGEFPYTGDVNNKKYLKDRAELFAKSGNGWWWGQGTHGYEGNGRKNTSIKTKK